MSCHSRTTQLNTGKKPHMTRVAVVDSCEARDDVLKALGGGTDWQVEKNAGTGAYPKEILAGQQRGNAQTSGLMLADDVIASGQHLVHWIAHVDLK